jgi:putative Holliday junction resolvase
MSVAAIGKVSPPRFGPVLAIDYGRKRWGLALSDDLGLTSRPLATWNRTNRRRDITRLRELVRRHGVRRVVVGLALHLDGAPSEMSAEAGRFAVQIGRQLGLPVALADERLTSWQAAQDAHEHRPRRGDAGLDARAAALILEEYLHNYVHPERPPKAAGTTGSPNASKVTDAAGSVGN